LDARVISSSTSRNWSFPKNTSSPTKKVGKPNAPRAGEQTGAVEPSSVEHLANYC
jgi:hypothetical protein